MALNIPIQTLIKIISQGDSKPWAKSFPPGPGRPPFFVDITFDNGYAGIYESWEIRAFEEGYSIHNIGNGFNAYGKDGKVYTSNEFDPANCKWYIEGGAGNMHKIKVPNQDLVWTVKRGEPDYPLTVFLEPADGSDNQSFSFAVVSDAAKD